MFVLKNSSTQRLIGPLKTLQIIFTCSALYVYIYDMITVPYLA